MSKRDPAGTSLKEIYEEVERQTGHRPQELEGPEFPEVMAYVWSAFIALSNSRSPGFSGPSPITYEQIKAFIEVTQTPLSPQEVDAIKRLDRIFLSTMSE